MYCFVQEAVPIIPYPNYLVYIGTALRNSSPQKTHKHFNSLQSTVKPFAVCTALFVHGTEAFFPHLSWHGKFSPYFPGLSSTCASKILSTAYKRFGSTSHMLLEV